MKDSLRLEWVEDKARLDNADADALRQYYRQLLQTQAFPVSLEMPAVLMVDEEAMKSLLDSTPKEHPPETSLQVKRQGAPWLWAVDVDHHFDGDQEEQYTGTLKVAVSSLIQNFFPVMATGIMGMEELQPAEGDNDVWFSVYNPY